MVYGFGFRVQSVRFKAGVWDIGLEMQSQGLSFDA